MMKGNSISAALFENFRPTGIVQLGAGQCTELDGYVQAGATKIVLVEANPVTADGLRRCSQDYPNVEVIESAVGPKAGSTTLRVYNFRELSGLRKPTGLLELFPGLRLEKEIQTQVKPCNQIIDGLALEDEQNLLIIDTPGEELVVLESLKEAGQLGHFQRVVFQCGTDPLYDNSASVDFILNFLKEESFELLHRADDHDPERPRCVLGRSKRLARALAELSLRESDLKDLQERYHQAQQLQERQHQLLVKVHERLSIASRYFHQLEDNDATLSNIKGEGSYESESEDLSLAPKHLSDSTVDEQ